MAEAIAALDRIFWEQLPAMEIGALYQGVNPVGGPEKAKAVSDSLGKTGLSLADTIYVGDSLTDVQAFEAARAGGGLTISFNGGREAVNAAEVIVVADSAWPLALLSCHLSVVGQAGGAGGGIARRPGTSPGAWCCRKRSSSPLAWAWRATLFNLYDQSAENLDKVIEESQAMRAKLRGETVAALG